MPYRSFLIAVLAALALAAPAQAAGPADYLRGAQNSDGGYGMTQSGGSQQFATGWALLGLAAVRPAARPGGAGVRPPRAGFNCARSATSSAPCSSCAPPGRTRAASAAAT